jgi:serine/threonine protein kinase
MPIPAQIGRYKIKSELGRGGMATVYLAFDPSFNRDVAIKVLPREMLHDPQFRVRFEREIKMAAGLEHPSIIPVYDVGEDDGQPYFVMRLMTGGSLSDMIARGRISLEETAGIVSKVAQGLAYAHRKHVIHRDLKPDNILFDDNGDPFISDFGVARLSESSGSLTGSGVIGTPAYMSPEQAQGSDIDHRSDIYCLGVIVYQMLSGRQPYSADTPMGVVVKHITEPVPEILNMVSSLPPEVDLLIKRAMAKDRNKRYASAVELAKALNMIAFGNEGNFTSVSNTSIRTGLQKVLPISQPSRGMIGVIVGVLVVIVFAVGVFLLRNQLFAPPLEATATTQPTAIPTELPPTSTAAPTSAPPTMTATETLVPYLPACAADVVIDGPEIKETNKICVEKKPYTAISIPEGATFQTLGKGLSCVEEKTANGKTIISCTGMELIAYDLKVCVPPVVSVEDAGKCEPGSTYSTANNCCVAPPPEGAGCVIFKVNVGACQ